MSTSWYSIKILKSVSLIFEGSFCVNNSTNKIFGFYEIINGLIDYNSSILAPTNHQIYAGADNIFNRNTKKISYYGTNIKSVTIDKYITSPIKFYYNLWNNGKTDIINNTAVTFVIQQILVPISNICFPAGIPIACNQGNIPIEKINPDIHTIRNKKIVGITKTITQDKYLVCFEKNALGTDIPSQKTIISKNHKIFYQGNMVEAKQFVGINGKVYKTKYRKEVLYNVLMEEHDKMIVNNLICETLNPKNCIAELYMVTKNLSPDKQNELIKAYNEYVVKNKIYISKT